LAGYVSTWSSYQTYLKSNNDHREPQLKLGYELFNEQNDVIDQLISKLNYNHESSISDHQTMGHQENLEEDDGNEQKSDIIVEWPTFMILAQK